jgi:hypothetical protein
MSLVVGLPSHVLMQTRQFRNLKSRAGMAHTEALHPRAIGETGVPLRA